jgi:glycosyltransferase involved in cell wall biosynthesis
MKVLHLDSGMDWRGGQQQVYYLTKGLRKLGMEQHLAFRQGGALASRVQQANLPITTLPLTSEVAPASIIQLAKIIKWVKPDIIHAHDSRTLGLAAVLRVFGEKAKLLAARRVAFPIRTNPFWKFKYQKQVDRIIAVSSFIREQLTREGIDSLKIDVVRDGYEFDGMNSRWDRPKARGQWGFAIDEFIIGCIGQFTPEKGHEFLIKGFKRVWEICPRARLVLVGDGALRGRYQKMINQLGLGGRISLTGFVDDLGKIFPALDLFVFPSLHEGLGSILLMAMAYQVPICASRTGGIPELVIEEQTGFLFPPGDPEALAKTLVQALKNRALAQLMSDRAFRRVRTEFSVERMISETYQIYTKVLSS